MTGAPHRVGEKVCPNELLGWVCTGLQGKPDKERAAVRRYRKGQWVMEVPAYSDRSRFAGVMSVRTVAQDEAYWSNRRQRRIEGVSEKYLVAKSGIGR